MGLLDKLFMIDKRAFKKIEKKANRVFLFEDEYSKLSDTDLKGKTEIFKKRLMAGETVDDILPEAFAASREAARRVLGQFPYPVQVFGATVLNEGDVAEMRTGEGKTLTATMAVYLNALEGKGVHVVTVNEYLASRDADWMGNVYRFMGLTVGCNMREKNTEEKKKAFNCDITYTTNFEVGFDYLRDNMAKTVDNRVLRGLHFAIVDEADSILIDESRTPLIISGGSGTTANTYVTADRACKRLRKDRDFTIDIEKKTCSLTDEGVKKIQQMFAVDNLYDAQWAELTHRIQQALKANYIMKKDVEYMVAEGEIQLIDSFTGRVMKGREYSDGLQQAIQAKEHVNIKPETVTLATITYQNFFRLYDKLSGMTGTAKTEEEEFRKVYNMRVVPIPTNRPIQRIDDVDSIFGNEKAKYQAIAADIKERHAKGQPILIGTPSVEKSEIVDKLLNEMNIPHEVLNAKNHAKEANIIALAGQKGAVTIATNMAGRGTDIKLGEGVKELGGLAVLATERNESRRIDNQLKGRSGRQGDPGYSKFYVSFEDEIFVRYAPSSYKSLYERLGDDAFQSRMMSGAITQTQKKVEGLNFDTRKQLLNYDDVLSRQRKIMYEKRDVILYSKSISKTIPSYFDLACSSFAKECVTIVDQEKVIDGKKLSALACEKMAIDPKSVPGDFFDGLTVEDAGNLLSAQLQKIYQSHQEEGKWTDDMKNFAEKTITLDCVDRRWTRHIDQMAKLREAIWLRSYAQTDPLQAYTNEGFDMFNKMNLNIALDVSKTLLHVAFRPNPDAEKASEENMSNVTPDKEEIDRSNPQAKIS
ncbi:MAG: preprotein translocase subunit SecA [Candidatus Enterosoma sp.]|nr:preprotein translocase subunit SecA [Bacilli bacterium]MDY5650070.1 preprotein translocase subunit SecA [Candidatus Enterosoma sp.]